MKISLLCTNREHPILPYLQRWKAKTERLGYLVQLCSETSQLTEGNILFLISCSQKIGANERKKFNHVLVLHASDLPEGRGWSPHIWQILQGHTDITVTLLEAAKVIDAGNIWKKLTVSVPRHFLWDEINDVIFKGELKLIDWAIRNQESVEPASQNFKIKPSYWPKRTEVDSLVDKNKTLLEQFDLLRVCDPERYPAYCEIHGRKYKLKLERFENEKK